MNLIEIAPSPAAFGLPPKFSRWRATQLKAIQDGITAPTRFVGQALACGAGKSLSDVTQGMLNGRAVYLCKTKALQTQLLKDFADVGMTDIRGRSNYTCVHGASTTVTCEDGAILGCKAHKASACPYVNHYQAALASPIPVTNYDYFMAVNKYGEGLGQVDTLICDEAATAVDAICSMLTIELANRELHLLRPMKPPSADEPIEFWKEWAKNLACVKAKLLFDKIDAQIKQVGAAASRDLIREYKATKKLYQDLNAVAALTGRWIVDDMLEYSNGVGVHVGYRFDPVWPSAYAEDVLFRGIPRILLTSATLNLKVCNLLGIPDKELTFTEYPGVFEPSHAPVTWLKSGARVDNNMSQDAIRTWIMCMDKFLRKWPVKGVIHCVSYQRQKDIYRLSSERNRLLWHNAWNTQAKIEEFLNEPADSVKALLSPSVTTGYDFEDDAARFAIIAKVPLVDTRSKIMKARTEDDKDYADHLAAQTVQQSAGRIVRNERDWGQTVVIDDHWEWWYWKVLKKGLISKWFERQVTAPTTMIPEIERFKCRG